MALGLWRSYLPDGFNQGIDAALKFTLSNFSSYKIIRMGSGQSFWPGVSQKGAKHLSEAGPHCEPFCNLTLALHLKKENKTKQQAD